MTVGETLTEARYRAGLSVDELSERTRIRGTVIRSIEEDDYQACGGDIYVRGYVRAIAGAVGIDAQPLIREYDMGRADGPKALVNGSVGPRGLSAGMSAERELPGVPSPSAAMTAFDLPAVAEAPADDVSTDDVGTANMEATRFDLPVVSADPAATAYDLPPVPEAPPTAELPSAVPPVVVPAVATPSAVMPAPATTETRFDLAPLPEDLMAVGYDLSPAESAQPDSMSEVIPSLDPGPDGPQAPAVPPAPASSWTVPGTSMPDGSARDDSMPDGSVPDSSVPDGTAPVGRTPRRRRGLFIAVAAAAVFLVAAGAVGVSLASGSTATKNTAATVVQPDQAASSVAAKASAAAQASASAAAEASAAAQASASAAAQARQSAANDEARRVAALPVLSATAYGPDGFADGDNPGNAKDAIARDASLPWSSQWYATPEFGMLKHGTGLLLDLGGKVTVTSLRLNLAQYVGSDVQIRIGNGTASPDLRLAAAATNAGGTVKFTLGHPAAGRYLLIWFTQLPPDGSGHYQASVSHVVITGRR